MTLAIIKLCPQPPATAPVPKINLPENVVDIFTGKGRGGSMRHHILPPSVGKRATHCMFINVSREVVPVKGGASIFIRAWGVVVRLFIGPEAKV